MKSWIPKDFKDGYVGCEGQRNFGKSMVEEQGTPLSKKIMAMLMGNVIQGGSNSDACYEFVTNGATGVTTYQGEVIDLDDINDSTATKLGLDFTDVDERIAVLSSNIEQAKVKSSTKAKKSVKTTINVNTDENKEVIDE